MPRWPSPVVRALLIGLLTTGCGNATENVTYDPVVERYIGTWNAVRMGNAALPYRTASTAPYTEVSSIQLTVGQLQFSFVETAQQYTAGSATPTAVGCVTSRRIKATSSTLIGTDVISASPPCPFPDLALNFVVAGDSLAVTYRGQRVVFVRQ
ncbi:MAG: hypothetical protein K2R93_00635 [Gemmatimonadaceae bacterium]|nr:hypothetical protein [Gemmatimonadaceae bacterium]